MSKKQTKTAEPTPLELASVKFEDDLSLALDNISGAAHMLATHATYCAPEKQQCALNVLSSMLFEEVNRVESARDLMKSLQAAESFAAGDTPTEGAKACDTDTEAFHIADTAHMDAITVKSAVERLASLVVDGELDTSDNTNIEAFVVFTDGIIARLDKIANALDVLTTRAGSLNDIQGSVGA